MRESKAPPEQTNHLFEENVSALGATQRKTNDTHRFTPLTGTWPYSNADHWSSSSPLSSSSPSSGGKGDDVALGLGEEEGLLELQGSESASPSELTLGLGVLPGLLDPLPSSKFLDLTSRHIFGVPNASAAGAM